MNTYLPVQSLTLFAANQVLTAAQQSTVYVGTTPPSDSSLAVVHYRHPVDFGVFFKADHGYWNCTGTPNVGCMRVRPEDIRPYHMARAGRNAVSLAPNAWEALFTGLHVFYTGMDSDLFCAIVADRVDILHPGMAVEYETNEQSEGEKWRRLIPDRIRLAMTRNYVDTHNLAVLEEDLKDFLLTPKTPKGGCLISSPYEAVFNIETGKLIALLPSEFTSWPQGFARFGFLIFDTTSHTLGCLDRASLPESLQRALNLFNDRFGVKAARP